jgi:hypothetical protein
MVLGYAVSNELNLQSGNVRVVDMSHCVSSHGWLSDVVLVD